MARWLLIAVGMTKFIFVALMFTGCQPHVIDVHASSRQSVTTIPQSIDQLVGAAFATCTDSDQCANACSACGAKPTNAGACTVCHRASCEACR